MLAMNVSVTDDLLPITACFLATPLNVTLSPGTSLMPDTYQDLVKS